MSFDLCIAPANEFLRWTEPQWDLFLNRTPAPELLQLGNAGYIGQVLEAIVCDLESGTISDTYPLLSRIESDDRPGWYQHEVGPLMIEVETIKKRNIQVQDLALTYFVNVFETLGFKAIETGQGLVVFF